jgi:1,2-diacylglycerol 3-alpha-glucosyltransferase
MMKRILLFTIAYRPYIGGAEVAIEELVKRMPDIHFDIITPRYSYTIPVIEESQNVTIHRIGWTTKKPIQDMKLGFFVGLNKIFFPVTSLLYIRNLKKENTFDMIWALMANYAGFAALLYKYFNKDTPYLLSLQEGDFEAKAAKKVRFIKPLFRKIFTKADHIQVISNYLENWAGDMGYKGEVDVIPNGVDMGKFNIELNRSEREKIRSKMVTTFDLDDTIIITTGRLVHKNGIDTLIEAMDYLSHDTQLVILAEGPMEKEYKKLAEKIPHDRVHFLGSVPNDLIPMYLKASDIFVRASRSEGQGISFIEAMAARTPIVATPVGGIVDFMFDPKDVSHRATGLFAEVNNPQSIAKKITTYAYDDTLREMIVDNAEKLAKEKYNWETISVTMNDMFNKIIDDKKN